MIINYKNGIIWTNSDLICTGLYININNFTTYVPIPRITVSKVEDYINLAKSFIDNYIEYNTDTSAEHPIRMKIQSDTLSKGRELKIKSFNITNENIQFCNGIYQIL